jgi:hypothetical protein
MTSAARKAGEDEFERREGGPRAEARRDVIASMRRDLEIMRNTPVQSGIAKKALKEAEGKLIDVIKAHGPNRLRVPPSPRSAAIMHDDLLRDRPGGYKGLADSPDY